MGDIGTIFESADARFSCYHAAIIVMPDFSDIMPDLSVVLPVLTVDLLEFSVIMPHLSVVSCAGNLCFSVGILTCVFLLVKYGNWYTFGLEHIVCACLLSLEQKPTKSVLFATIVMGTLLVSADDLPGKILEPALVIALPLLLGAFISTVVWALAAFPTPTAYAPCAERLALTTVVRGAVTAHFAPRRGAVARNAAEPTDKVGSLCTFGLAHAIYLILLFLEEVKPQRHILAATVLLATIVFKSGDHPSETLNKFVWLVTVWYIFALTGLLGVVFVLLTTSHQLTTAVIRWLSSFVLFRWVMIFYRLAFRNDMLATFPAPATTVFGRLDGVDSVITSSCVDRAFSVDELETFFSRDQALSVDESETYFSLDSDNAKPKRCFCCVSWC
ncbi:hypothetical protein Tco_0939907 [Tanacetum coccineum]|uniref:Transmembrane protein n=1 Tax=Tanacetum coccineum TaxID=301880 RepID=A0ABQ5DM99_9ASTR